MNCRCPRYETNIAGTCLALIHPNRKRQGKSQEAQAHAHAPLVASGVGSRLGSDEVGLPAGVQEVDGTPLARVGRAAHAGSLQLQRLHVHPHKALHQAPVREALHVVQAPALCVRARCEAVHEVQRAQQ